MKKPEMILFDCGHTLICESSFNGVRGTEALLKHAVRNEYDLTAEEISRFFDKMFADMGRSARDNGGEVHNHMFQRRTDKGSGGSFGRHLFRLPANSVVE